MKRPEIICPAGTPESFKAAVDAGADGVYFGFKNAGNARNFPGLNFSLDEAQQSISYAKNKNRKTFVAINSFAQAGRESLAKKSIDDAVALGVSAIILADIGLLDYASKKYPDFNKHLSVQASASSAAAVNFFQREFGIKRVVLPRVLSFDEIKKIKENSSVEIEIFGFGGLCVMAEGRCSLSSYSAGKSPNINGVCSPAERVNYEYVGEKLNFRLGKFVINEFAQNQPACYPTTCKGCYSVGGEKKYIFENPVSLNLIGEMDKIFASGIDAIKIEGRQRGKSYVGNVAEAFRKAVDSYPNKIVPADLSEFMEGGEGTAGAYLREWC